MAPVYDAAAAAGENTDASDEDVVMSASDSVEVVDSVSDT